MTAIVLARDEETYIGGCLRSLRWADAILVLVDDRTDDATPEIARRYTPHVHRLPFESFPSFRNRALDLAATPWVLFVDADERVSRALAVEVREALAGAGQLGPVGYWVPRRNRILGRWMRGTGWWPDLQLRLLRRDAARYDAAGLVHEVATLDGRAGRLRHPLVHHNYASLGEFLAKQEQYARLDAQTRWGAGERARLRALPGQPLREFWRRYATLGGYRDGALGLLLAALMGYAVFQRTRRLLYLGARAAATSAEGARSPA